MVANMKARESGSSTVAERLHKWMVEFSDEPGNIGRIFIDVQNGKKIATCITMQTRMMREMFSRFPEVLMIDATHGTNVSKHKVFLMAHDVFGHGRYVQHALVQNERYETLETAIETFKKHNPAWEKLRCVVIDKDFTEISVLKAAFPNVTILLCHFHVIKYLHEEIANSEYGFTAWQKEQIRASIYLLVYSSTEREYQKNRRFMSYLINLGAAPRSTTEMPPPVSSSEQSEADQEDPNTSDDPSHCSKHPFEIYFTNNWDNCKEMWCAYTRQSALTLGNNTNNRLESSWKQLKDILDPFMKVDECIAAMMCYQAQMEEDFISRVFKLSVVQHAEYDEEMSHLANLVSEHACQLIHKQYQFALTRAAYRWSEAVPGIYFIQNDIDEEDYLDEPAAEYSITRQTWTCSCKFMSTHLLPCRHIFYLRKILKMETIIPTQCLAKRWLLSAIRAPCLLPDLSEESFRVNIVPTRRSAPWDVNRKYREANEVASAICGTMSGFGMPEYRKALGVLKRMEQLIKSGQVETIERLLLTLVPPTSHNMPGAEPLIQSRSLQVGRMPSSPPVSPPVALLGSPTSSARATIELRPSVPAGAETSEHTLNQRSGSNRGESVGDPAGAAAIVQPVISHTNDRNRTSSSESNSRQITLTKRTTHVDFRVEGPPQARGRPRQNRNVQKAKRNKSIEMAAEDSALYDQRLSLANVDEALKSTLSYSSTQFFRKFNVYNFAKRPKAPTAYVFSKVPTGKTILEPLDLTRVLPAELLQRCQAKVTALQKKHADLAEMDTALEIHGVGIFSAGTLRLMRKWHQTIAALNRIDTAIRWIETIDFSQQVPERYFTQLDDELPQRIRQLDPLSNIVEFLDVAGKGLLGDMAISRITAKLYGQDRSNIALHSTLLGCVVKGKTTTDMATIENAFHGLSTEKILIPINCNGNHWCSIMIDMNTASISYYDPMSSSYASSARILAEKLKSILSKTSSRRFRTSAYVTDMGVQVDSYSCGMFVLLAFEEFTGGASLGYLSKPLLAYLRYRYLLLCV